MLINKDIINIIYYSVLAASLAAAVVYVKQHSILKNQNLRHKQELKHLKQDCNTRLSEMEAYINSLSSRVKHLTLDNRRLSTTGYKLSQQLEDSVVEAVHEPKLSEYKKLHLELTNLDQHIITKYENFITEQKNFAQLGAECNYGKSKDPKCAVYNKTADSLESVSMQIKFLKTKREVLTSQIARVGM